MRINRREITVKPEMLYLKAQQITDIETDETKKKYYIPHAG
jgi:hypothetical protein